MKAIYVTQQEPSAIGTGGAHRAYQIAYDLGRAVGADNVQVISFPQWCRTVQSVPANKLSAGHISRFLQEVRHWGRSVPLFYSIVTSWRRSDLHGKLVNLGERLPFLLAESPLDQFVGTSWVTRGLCPPEQGTCEIPAEFVSHYADVVRDMTQPAVCLIEHACFAGLLPINAKCGIPTVCCPQNLDSLATVAPLNTADTRKIYSAALCFADEYEILSRCRARLFISKVEVGLVGGLGLSSIYYPYLPVGAIRDRLGEIRSRRRAQGIEPGLFLLCGTASWGPIGASVSWFVENARRFGLPPGVKVVIAGNRTDEILPQGVSVPGIELRGWLPQNDLDDLMVCAEAMLVPQRSGLGASTRLSEAACAGIPTLTSRHAALALDLPPGVRTVDDDWAAWCQALDSGSWKDLCSVQEDYETWERQQSGLPASFLKDIVAGGS